MQINFNKFPKLPKIAWVLIALGVFALLAGAGIALAKFGKIEISRTKIEKAK